MNVFIKHMHAFCWVDLGMELLCIESFNEIYQRVFQSGCTIYIPRAVVKRSPYFRSYQHFLFSVLILAILIGE